MDEVLDNLKHYAARLRDLRAQAQEALAAAGPSDSLDTDQATYRRNVLLRLEDLERIATHAVGATAQYVSHASRTARPAEPAPQPTARKTRRA